MFPVVVVAFVVVMADGLGNVLADLVALEIVPDVHLLEAGAVFVGDNQVSDVVDNVVGDYYVYEVVDMVAVADWVFGGADIVVVVVVEMRSIDVSLLR